MTEQAKKPVFSMTGYASASCELSASSGAQRAVNISVELRTVNSRFLEFHFRLPEEILACEPALREILAAKLLRGKIEVRVNLKRSDSTHETGALNRAALEQLAALQQQVLEVFPDAPQLRINEILRWPNILADNGVSDELDTLRSTVLACSKQALNDLLAARSREGTRLARVLLNNVAAMRRIVTNLTPLIPQLLTTHQQKITGRMQEALGLAAPEGSAPLISCADALERIRQEVTLYGIRIDVAEELARLSTHLDETQELLEQGGRLGKRLDFMMQELNREANTLGAKSAALELTDASMQLKLLIEQMREQVQNLE